MVTNPGMKFQRLSGPEAERVWRRDEKRRAEYNKVLKRRQREDAILTQEFIGWDGEGPQDAGYALFREQQGFSPMSPVSFIFGVLGFDHRD